MSNAQEKGSVKPVFPRVMGRLSIKYKLIVIIMSVSAIVMLVMGGAFIFYQIMTFRQRMVDDLMVHAVMLADNCTASLSFHNAQDAENVLSSFEAKRPVMLAGIYDKDGFLFALYRRKDVPMEITPSSPSYEGHRFVNKSLVIFHPIILDDRSVGTVFLRSVIQEFDSRL